MSNLENTDPYIRDAILRADVMNRIWLIVKQSKRHDNQFKYLTILEKSQVIELFGGQEEDETLCGKIADLICEVCNTLDNNGVIRTTVTKQIYEDSDEEYKKAVTLAKLYTEKLLDHLESKFRPAGYSDTVHKIGQISKQLKDEDITKGPNIVEERIHTHQDVTNTISYVATSVDQVHTYIPGSELQKSKQYNHDNMRHPTAADLEVQLNQRDPVSTHPLDVLVCFFANWDNIKHNPRCDPALSFTILKSFIRKHLDRPTYERLDKGSTALDILTAFRDDFREVGSSSIINVKHVIGDEKRWNTTSVETIMNNFVKTVYHFPMSTYSTYELLLKILRQAGQNDTQLAFIGDRMWDAQRGGRIIIDAQVDKLTPLEVEECTLKLKSILSLQILEKKPIIFDIEEHNSKDTLVLQTSTINHSTNYKYRQWLTREEFLKKYPKGRYFNTREEWLQHKKENPNEFKKGSGVSYKQNTKYEHRDVTAYKKTLQHENNKNQEDKQTFIGIHNASSTQFYISFLCSRAFNHKYRMVVDSGSSVNLIPYHSLNDKDKKNMKYMKHIGIKTVGSDSSETKIIGYMKLRLMNRLHKVYVGTHTSDIILLSATELAKQGLNLECKDQKWYLHDSKLSKKYSQTIKDGVVCLPPINTINNNVDETIIDHSLHNHNIYTANIDENTIIDSAVTESSNMNTIIASNDSQTDDPVPDAKAQKVLDILTKVSHIHISKPELRRQLAATRTNWRDILNKDTSRCITCLKGKMRSFSHPMTKPYRNARPGEDFSCDVGYIPQSGFNGENLFMLIVDRHTKFIHTAPMVRKQYEVIEKIVKPFTYMNNNIRSTSTMQTFKVDNAPELVKLGQMSWFKKLGIRLLTTVAGNPFQNGRAERYIGVITDDIRTIIEDTGLPWILWPLVLDHVTQLRNAYKLNTIMVDGKETQQTAWETNLGTQPDLNWFNTFGCQMYIHGRNANHVTKDTPKATACIYMGNHMQKRAHRVILLDEHWKRFMENPTVQTVRKLNFKYAVDGVPFNDICAVKQITDEKLAIATKAIDKIMKAAYEPHGNNSDDINNQREHDHHNLQNDDSSLELIIRRDEHDEDNSDQDIIIDETKEVGEDIVAKIQEKYTLRVMGEPKAFLNTEIERDQDKVYLSNKVQIDELVEETKDMLKYDIKPDNIMDTPIQQLYKVPMSQETENQTHEENDNTILLVPETREPHENQEWCHDLETTKTRLKEIIGSLIYVATSCRPDISTAVSMLATRISKPDDKILQDVARLLRYLRHTRNYELCLQDKMKDGKINIEIYADASHDNGAKSKSRMGICVLMNGSLVKWTSKTIASTCRSTTEAEVYAACEATKLAITYKNVIKDIFGETVQPIIYIDNSTCAKIQRDEVVPKETAYMINHFHFAKQYVLSKEIRIESISTKDMLADGLTKALGKTKFWEQNVAWGLVDRTEDYEKIHYVQVYQKEKGKCQNN